MNDIPVDDILIDTGATISVVAQDLLPRNIQTTGQVLIMGFDNGEAKRYPTTIIDLEIGEHQFSVRAAFADRSKTRHSVILGQNLVTPTLKELLPDLSVPLPEELQALQMVNVVLTQAASKPVETLDTEFLKRIEIPQGRPQFLKVQRKDEALQPH